MSATQLGRVQLLIMQVLWTRAEATARDITDAINETEPIAHSTVQTLLRGLEDKNAVDHKAQGRTFVFFPLIEEDNFKSSATQELVSRVFGGNAGDLVAHLLADASVSVDELVEIRKLINRNAKRGKQQ
jgi:BlaI family penicillinase repressor